MDFEKIFKTAIRYPFDWRIFSIYFIFNFLISFPIWISLGTTQMSTMEGISSYFGLLVPLWIISFFVGTFIIGFYYDNSSRFFPRMKRTAIKKSLEVAKKRYIPLLGTQFLLSVVFFCVFFVFGGFSLLPVLSGASFDTASVLIGSLIGSAALLVALFFLFLTPFACVLDKLNPIRSIKKSFSMINKNKMDTFAFLILLLIINYIISFIGMIPIFVYEMFYEAVTFNMFPFFLFQTFFSVLSYLFAISSITNFYLTLKGANVKKKKKRKK